MKKNTVALSLVFCLFFLWAISSNLLPTMIRQLMKTCELNTFEASFTETAYWLAYFICPIPIAMYMRKYSYKSGIVFGLLLAAFGGLLFFPAAAIREYWFYLCVFFIIATGMCFLETAAIHTSPYWGIPRQLRNVSTWHSRSMVLVPSLQQCSSARRCSLCNRNRRKGTCQQTL